MTDILGPATPHAVTSRPSRSVTRGGTPTWFQNCSSPTALDGTELGADFFNDVLAQLRTTFDSAGIAEDNADDMLWRAIQSASKNVINLQQAAFPQRQDYGTPGTYDFVVPAGVTKIRSRVWGAGASGGNGLVLTAGGSGGGGGGFSEKVCTVTPGQHVTVTVGTGGAACATGASSDGQNGTSSSFGAFCSATGGVAGQRGISASNPGTPIGVGGSGVGGDNNQTGATGDSGAGDPNTDAEKYGGRGGAAPLGGSGGCMTTGSPANGLWPGGGGSGGGGNAGQNTPSGRGADGRVLLEWVAVS